jgi:hypothetical protein
VTSDHELPPGVDLARADVDNDPQAAEARGLALMATAAPAIIEGVEQHGEAYILRRATDLLEAWGRTPEPERQDAVAQLGVAAQRASARVLDELRALLAADAASQRRTPLEIVRTLGREPSAVLAAFGVPPIVRDAFEERALPDDVYGLAPRTFADIGDADLGAMLLAWGVGKATVARARSVRAVDDHSAQMGRQRAQGHVDNRSVAARGDSRRRSTLGTIASRALAAFRARAHLGSRTGRP